MVVGLVSLLVGERLLDGLIDLGRLAGVTRSHDLEELLVDRFAGSRALLRLWRHAPGVARRQPGVRGDRLPRRQPGPGAE